ncbi:MAG TPA: VCBS repeat-containing protein [Thermoanaerobaculia bacterium]|nr:VCBS repeat-containing protein [Thermoanaerobaculia bacterium]
MTNSLVNQPGRKGYRPSLPVLLLAALLTHAVPAFCAGRLLPLRGRSLDLPGAPAAVVSTDVDGDGRRDLAVVAAYNQWDEIAITESSTMDDVQGLVEVMTIVPAVIDRREIRVYRARPDGSYEPPRSVALPLSVLSLEAGPPGAPAVAVTDEGASILRLGAGSDAAPVLEPWIADPPVMAGTGNFLGDLGLVRDVNGDGVADLLLPARDGLAVYLGRPEGKGLARRAASRLPVPGEVYRSTGDLERRYPLPQIRDVTGDGRPDLLFRDPVKRWRSVWVARNGGQGRFQPAVEVALGTGNPRDPNPVWMGDFEGNGLAEVVFRQSLDDPKDGGIRKELEKARQPKGRLTFRRLNKDLVPEKAPYRTFDVTGWGFEAADAEVELPGGFQDLNGDRRPDLVTVTMDVGLPKLLGSLATKRLTVGLDFHVWCQQKDGAFRAVKGLDLSGSFRFDLNNLRVSQLSLFSGDFDGDGRSDFVQLGRGKRVSIQRGRADCSFPSNPDLSFDLREEPQDLSLVQIRDLDGDGRSDLMIVTPRRAAEEGFVPPVRLDLYLSGGGK